MILDAENIPTPFSSSRLIMWRIRRAVRMALRRERYTLMRGIKKIMRR